MDAYVLQCPELAGAGFMSEKQEVMRIGELLILAALWMLFGFMLWYYLSAFHGIPVRLMAEKGLSMVLGEQFYNIIPNPDQHYLFQVQTRILYTFRDGSKEALGFIVNPLIYGYGLPLLFGLVMATRQSLLHKLGTLLAGYIAVMLVQVWGVFWESLKMMSFNFGAEAQQAVQAAGVNETLVALCYQLGVLILPPLAPVIIWVLGSWEEVEHFIEGPLARRKDPGNPER
jgi:hypothetical protein